jgi:hypothetical protein
MIHHKISKLDATPISTQQTNDQPKTDQSIVPYESPRVRTLGSLRSLRGGYSGTEYDGPGRYYFDGF